MSIVVCVRLLTVVECTYVHMCVHFEIGSLR